MVSRRAFLQATAAAGSAALLPRPSHGALRPRLERIGIQLYTLRSEMRNGVERTLSRVAAIGYREVEFAGYFDHGPAEIRGMLERTGLAAPAAHVGFPDPADAWRRALDAAAAIGHAYVVTPWIPPEWRARGYGAVAELFNQAGAAARERGLGFAYHNHDFEFAPMGDRTPFAILLDESDPALVAFELDLFWVTKAGGDPLDLFARHPARFPMVHVKDMGPDGAMVDVGDGRIDFAAIFARRAEAGIRHYFVEHDQPAAPFETARRSFAYLRALEL